MLSQHTPTHCNTLQYTATHCNTPQHTVTSHIQYSHTRSGFTNSAAGARVATCRVHSLQHIALHCNTLQHAAMCLPGGTGCSDEARRYEQRWQDSVQGVDLQAEWRARGWRREGLIHCTTLHYTAIHYTV